MGILDTLKAIKPGPRFRSDEDDDRHFCHECRNLEDGHCMRQQFRPVDDIVRRCEDYETITL